MTCLLIVAVVFLIFVLGRLYQSQFDPTSFVVAGDRYCDVSQVPTGLTVLKSSDGFDGQFYYRWALHPFTSQRTAFGITLDAPALRHQRIAYPVLSSMFSLGNPNRLPWAMILINLCALCLMGWLGALLAQSFKLTALWGIFLPLYPGFLFTLSRDTVEILEATILLGCLVLLRRGKALPAALLLTLAVFTKETSLLLAFAAASIYFVGKLWKPGRGLIAWYFFAIPIVCFIAWQLVLFRIWGEVPIFSSGSSNLGLPFVGFFRSLAGSFGQTPFQLRIFVELLFLLGFGLAVLFNFWDGRVTRAGKAPVLVLEKTSWLLFAALAAMLGSGVWIEDWTFMRVLSTFYVLGVMVLINSRSAFKFPILGSALFLWCVLFFKLMRSYTLG